MVFKKKPQHDNRTAHQEREHFSLVTCCRLTFSAKIKNGHSLMFCITIFLEFLDVCFVMLVLALHPGVLWALLQRPVVGQQSLGWTQKNVTRRVRGDGKTCGERRKIQPFLGIFGRFSHLCFLMIGCSILFAFFCST